jgi:hypothetical protein
VEERGAMSDKLAELEARVRALEDVREINDAFFHWHYECTGGFNGKQAGREGALDVLTDDAMIDAHPAGRGKGPKGRAQCKEFWDYFYGDNGPLPYVFQTSVAERVTLKGDTATPESNMLGMFQNRGGKPRIGLSQRINEFVRTPQGWRIRYTNIEGGFAAFADEFHGALNKLPDQEPRTLPTFDNEKA